MSETAYPSLDIAEDLFKKTVWDTAINASLASLFTAVPVLAVWPLKSLVTRVTHLLSEKFYAALKMFVDLRSIQFVNESHKRAFDAASVSLKIIAHSYGIESNQFKQAREEAHNALSRFASFGAYPRKESSGQ